MLTECLKYSVVDSVIKTTHTHADNIVMTSQMILNSFISDRAAFGNPSILSSFKICITPFQNTNSFGIFFMNTYEIQRRERTIF